MDRITMLSFNARGLGLPKKRRKIFNHMRKRKLDIVLLQETHGTDKVANLWYSEYGGNVVMANGQSNARGVALLLSKHIKPETVIRDFDGRFLIIKFALNGYTYCVANVYAPNNDDPSFFNEVFKEVEQMECVYNIIGGDFNTVMEGKMDRANGVVYHHVANNVIKAQMEAQSMIDVWRVRNPTDKKFTWNKYDRSRNKFSWSRIDYFLISEALSTQVMECDITPGVFSDHSMVNLTIGTSKSKRGPGYWKINNEYLEDELYCETMLHEMQWTKETFSYLDSCRLWEMLKFEIANATKEFALSKSKKERKKEYNLFRLLCEMQDKVVQVPTGSSREGLNNNIRRVEAEIDSFEEMRTRRTMFRCKAQWYEKGQKSTKYFFNLEKRNYTNKTMYSVRKRDGTLTKDYREILETQYDFYKELYSTNPEVQFTQVNRSRVGIPEHRKLEFELFVSKEELFDGMMTLKQGKCQGLDGISLEFYRKFWKVLVDPLHAMLQQAYEEGKLSFSARRGVINLIPKKGSCLEEVAGWRPVALLNYDYKIFAKALSNRMDIVMEEIVGPEQNGFIRGRTIMANLTATREVLAYLNRKNRPGIIAIVDYSKCFDRIEYQSIKGMLKYLNYGDNFIRMVFLLFNEFEVCTVNNGHLSNYLRKARGVNQGCPASPGLYVQTSTLLAHLIAERSDIKGISLPGLTQLLSQFADDTTAFLSYDSLTLNGFCEVLTQVEEQLGLKISYEKTTLYRVGSLAKSQAKIYTSKPLNWSNGPIELLGMAFNCDGSPCHRNVTKIHGKMDAVLDSWKTRTLNLIGKVMVVNSLIGSLFVYSMSVMVNLTTDELKGVQDKIHTFLWNGKKRGKIAMTTLCKDKKDGGLRLVNLTAKQEALKIQMIFKFKNLLNCLYEQTGTESLRDTLWRCNMNETDSRQRFGDSSYWAQTLNAWCKINFKWPDNKAEVLEQVIWLNTGIKIQGKLVLWPKWIEAGVLLVEDLLDEQGNVITWEVFNTKFTGLNWMNFASLCTAIPPMWRIMAKNRNCGRAAISLFEELGNKAKITREVYDKIIQDYNALLKYAKTWVESWLPNLDYEEYRKSFRHMHDYIKDPKLKDFQYRLLLNKLVFNKELYDWGMIESNSCILCQEAEENIVHYFYECAHSKKVWKEFKEVCEKNQVVINVNFKSIVMNEVHETASNIMNYICCIIKQFMYKQRCLGNGTVEGWKWAVEEVMNMEIFIAKRKGKLFKVVKKWAEYQPELLSMLEGSQISS